MYLLRALSSMVCQLDDSRDTLKPHTKDDCMPKELRPPNDSMEQKGLLPTKSM